MTMAVTPLSFSQRNKRRSSARTMPWLEQAGEQRFDGVEHHALGADGVDGVAQADEQTARDRIRRSPRSRCARSARNRGAASCVPPERRQIEAERGDVARPVPRSVSSKAMKTPGSLNSVAPRTRNSMPSSVLPQPALPQTSVGRPCGRPPIVISSKPRMPVGVLAKPGSASAATFALRLFIPPRIDDHQVEWQQWLSDLSCSWAAVIQQWGERRSTPRFSERIKRR